MKKKKKQIKHIGIEQFILANKIANREIELTDKTGWTSVNKPHKNKKKYTRKSKHKTNNDA